MSKIKLRMITIVALTLLFVLTLGMALAVLPVARTSVDAATYTPSSLFSAGSDGEVGASEAVEGTSWVEFSLKDGGKVYYRRDLAFKWFVADEEAKKEEDSTLANPGKPAYFSMSFSFAPAKADHPAQSGETAADYKICPRCLKGSAAEERIAADAAECPYCHFDFTEELLFKTFEIAFESAEENVTKDGLTTNILHFEYEDHKLQVSVKDSSFEEGDEPVPHPVAYTKGDVFTLTFGEPEPEEAQAGVFTVSLQVGETTYKLENFTNVGGYFSEYRSSTATTPQIPMTFTAELPETQQEAEAAVPQRVLMRSLNGQTFETDDEDKVTDNAEPVLVLNEALYSFRLGQSFSLSYEAIDVCRDSVTLVRSYYMLRKDTDDDGNETSWHKPDESASSTDYKSLSTSTYFMPTTDKEEEIAYVSIRFRLDDGTHSDYYVYLTWYAADAKFVRTMGDEGVTTAYTCQICGHTCTPEEFEELQKAETFACPGEKEQPKTTETGDPELDENGKPVTEKVPCTATAEDYEAVGNYGDYILVDREAEGPYYRDVAKVPAADADHPAHNDGAEAQERWANYQAEVAKAAEKVSAGDGAYLYLPSMRDLIGSDYADYRNLSFSVYYYKPGTSSGGSATSATSLRYNNLRIEVEEKGDYRFRVIAQDAAGNPMKYYDEDGELVTLSSSNVWDIEGIPEFTFYIDYSGPSIEEMDKQTEGYRDRTYSISGFDVIALQGYETEYTLYRLDKESLPEDKKNLEYSELVEAIKGLKKEELPEWLSKDNVLVEIKKYNNEVEEGDAEWENTDNDYAWDPDSSLSFVPQETGFYLVEITVVDAVSVGLSTTAYQAIYIRNPMDRIAGRSKWLENNLTSIVLFAISAVLLVAIIVLFVVKPSEKTVEEVDLESLKGKKKNSKNDKNNKKE